MLAASSSTTTRRTLGNATRLLGRSMASATFNSQSTYKSPRPPIELDPSLAQLLNDADTSVNAMKRIPHTHPKPAVELHVFDELQTEAAMAEDLGELEPREERRSPAAVLGSYRVGGVYLSEELEEAITGLVEKSDKHQLRSDAKRLFLHPSAADATRMRWDTKIPKYASKRREKTVGGREGLAFATVALPAQYAAICSVFDEMKLRLGDDFQIDQVIDFGAKAGAGLWASRASFDNIVYYLGLDNRSGITSLAKDIIKMTDLQSTEVDFKNFWGKEGHDLMSKPEKTVALCAFSLSDLNSDVDRKQMLREIWSTDADYMVVIDRATREGFQYVGEARDYLLRKGRKEVLAVEEELKLNESGSTVMEDPIGSHVVAPCPHDGACPLFTLLPTTRKRKNKVLPDPMGPTSMCHFTQRLHRPEFVRKTKHAPKAHEDVTFSYVVVKRGPRPTTSGTYFASSGPARMRLGAVAREEAMKVALKERMEAGGSGVVQVDGVGELHFRGSGEDGLVEPIRNEEQSAEDRDGLRRESYSWPRIIYPPMKRSGHVILDSCTSDGNISRITIPKSQGKQAYYDARKAEWGDIFPHAPKNGLEIRKRGQGTDEEEAAIREVLKYSGTYSFGEA